MSVQGVAGQVRGAPTSDVGTRAALRPAAEVGAAVPMLPGGGGSIEVMAALLTISSAHGAARIARECEKAAKEEQISALQRQVGELQQKAADMRTEGLVAGSLLVAGGLTTMGAAGISKVDHAVANARATALGSMLSQLGAPLAKATAGAAQVKDDAGATQAAADAKLHEAAKDEYASMAKDAQQTIERAMQAIQSFAAEHSATARAILQHGA